MTIHTPRPWKRFDATQPTRVAKACNLIGQLTATTWQPWRPLVDVVAAATLLKPKTVDNLLYGMTARTADLERRGRYSRNDDGRQVRLNPTRRQQ